MSSTHNNTGLLGWIDDRFPLSKLWNEHMAQYYAPKNFNFWYYFGSLALLVLVIQIVSGIFLTMHYKPDAAYAFASVEYIMRDVPWGWLIRYLHSTGAAFFFIVVYLHMFRGLMYGSYRKPRELVWLIGVFILLTMMAEAFAGYTLPWGQMSFWGAEVIISLFGTVPFVGDAIATWIRGDFVASDATLGRLFALHVIVLPLVLIALVVLHIIALHEVGSNNPDGIEIKKHKDENGKPLDGIPFHPYYSVKDLVGFIAFLLIFSFFVFFMPTGFGYFLKNDNFIPANPLVTPDLIMPPWYFGAFYAILRTVPNEFGGVLLMFAAVLMLALLPWLDRSPVKSIRYRGWIHKTALTIFAISFLILTWLGVQPADPALVAIGRVFAVLYFAFFLLMPFYSKLDKTKPVPERVTFK